MCHSLEAGSRLGCSCHAGIDSQLQGSARCRGSSPARRRWNQRRSREKKAAIATYSGRHMALSSEELPSHRQIVQTTAKAVNACHPVKKKPRWSSKAAEATSSASGRSSGLYGSVGGLGYHIREASSDDWWQVAEILSRGFYPHAGCLMGVLLRFDRVESLMNGAAQGKQDAAGNFACFAACLDADTSGEELSTAMFTFEQAFQGAVFKRIPKFLKIFVPQPMQEAFRQTPEERGMIGTVIVDSMGQFVPKRQRDGFEEDRPGMAYVCNLAVHSMFRRQGIGRKLLAHATKVAQDWGCRAVLLQIDARNKGARQMYVEEGFRHVAFEPWILQFLEWRAGCRLELMVKRLKKSEPCSSPSGQPSAQFAAENIPSICS